MEPRPGFTLQQLWTTPSYEVKDNDIRRAVTPALAAVPAATLPDSAFLSALATPAARMVPPQMDHWHNEQEKSGNETCENKAVAILERMQAGRPALIKKDGGEMLTAIVLDRPLAEAKALVEAPNAFMQAIESCKTNRTTQSLRMINPEANDDPAPSERAASSSGGHSRRGAVTRPPAQPNTQFHGGQREVLTVVPHQTPVTALQCSTPWVLAGSLERCQSTSTREAPTVSPKSLLISGAKNEPSGHGEVLLLK